MSLFNSQWAFGNGGGSSQAMASTDKILGAWINMDGYAFACWTPRWTGTPTGAFAVEGSNEYDVAKDGVTGNPADLVTLPTTKNWTDPAGSASKTGIDIGATGYKYLRLVYTNSGGSGTLTAKCHKKAAG